MSETAHGYCRCGCGDRTRLAPQSSTRRGWKRGEPISFIQGHHSRIRRTSPDNFWAKVDSTAGAEACWPWTGYTTKRGGYGMVGSRPRRGAHRVAYEFGVGPIPDGLFVLHECDNPKCCNPAHLRVGTQAENIRQCVERGRKHVSSIRATSKLTHEKAAQIRSLYAAGSCTQEQLAKRFGVTGERIHSVIHGRAWKAPA